MPGAPECARAPPGFAIITRKTGCGLYVFVRNSSSPELQQEGLPLPLSG
jgi:hypothetical protein